MDMSPTREKRFVVEERSPGVFSLVDRVVKEADTEVLGDGKVIWVYDAEDMGVKPQEAKKQATAAARERNLQPLYDLVGTAEAAEILTVERPRIGRWKKTGVLPPPILELATGPIWLRKDIVALIKERESRRRTRGSVDS